MVDIWNTLRPQIERFTKPFPRAAIAFANSHREELTPHLIEVLEKLAINPSLADDGSYALHLYAMHLLASWREPRAFAAMAALGHHDDDTVDAMLGDTVTETYGRCLASVCSGDLAPLKALFEDTQASHWVRNAALDAMAVRVLEGDGPRDELVTYLTTQGEAQAARVREHGRDELDVMDCIVSVASDIGALEMREQINGWFDAGWLDEMMTSKVHFGKAVVRPFETCRSSAGVQLQGYVSDVQAAIGWMAGFAEEPKKMQQPLEKTSPQQMKPSAEIKQAAPTAKPVRTAAKVGRNDPCPCGSGKKYKKCHGES